MPFDRQKQKHIKQIIKKNPEKKEVVQPPANYYGMSRYPIYP